MHIPDGYLSPATCATTTVAMVPVWAVAARKVRALVSHRNAPLLALAAAYSFVVMMFNIPIPDGTSAHAVGAVLIAVLLGPWAAVIAVSIALAIQALFFGDGGVLSYGANALNIAFVMPMVGVGIYRLLTTRTSLTAPWRAIAAGIASYVGINAAALATAIELGLQPTLFHSANGTPLYAPFRLHQTIPAMAFAHLTLAGAVEFVLAVAVITYLQRANVPLLRINHPNVPETDDDRAAEPAARGARVKWRGIAVGLGVAALLSPLGLIATGTAFGEDAPDDLDFGKYGLRTVPSGLQRSAGYWKHAALDGYDLASAGHPVLGYVLSAFVGMAAVALVVFSVNRVSRNGRPPRVPESVGT